MTDDDEFPAADWVPPAGAPSPPTGDPTAAHDAAVVAALYRRATGGQVWREVLDKVGEVRVIREELLPDVAAARKWLESRAPDAWADKRTQEFRVIVARIDGREQEGVSAAIEGQAVEVLPR